MGLPSPPQILLVWNGIKFQTPGPQSIPKQSHVRNVNAPHYKASTHAKWCTCSVQDEEWVLCLFAWGHMSTYLWSMFCF